MTRERSSLEPRFSASLRSACGPYVIGGGSSERPLSVPPYCVIIRRSCMVVPAGQDVPTPPRARALPDLGTGRLTTPRAGRAGRFAPRVNGGVAQDGEAVS